MTKDIARCTALEVIYQILEEGAYANLGLDKALFQHKELSRRDRGFITEMVYGSVKYKARLDWIINKLGNIKIDKQNPWVRNILRMSVYQMYFMDKVPVSAAINEGVSLCKIYAKGKDGFVNALLRNIDRNQEQLVYPNKGKNPVQYLSVYYSFPQWMIENWVKDYGKKNAENLCRFFNEPASLWIRANTLKNTREELEVLLKERGIESVRSVYADDGLKILSNVSLRELDLFQEGRFIVQDESSMLVAQASGVQSGMKVLDVCSAPGGKSTHMAQYMKNKGSIISCDIYEHRLGLIEENAKRLDIEIIQTKLQDGRFLTRDFTETFDLVLVDAPCSGLGVLGRRADARWKKHKSDIEELSLLQKEILPQAAALVKEGGILLYSTCTIDKKENTEMIEWFLKNHPEFRLCDSFGERWRMYCKMKRQWYNYCLLSTKQTDFLLQKWKGYHHEKYIMRFGYGRNGSTDGIFRRSKVSCQTAF